ncbi:hypothetical protein CSC2_29660 [Clostridium zeae]|uniref:Tetratricopeptide repeat protein n=1 Tax=Clostridium zeae TaxID=2759022 RepID=A0ABQ1ECC1_9CLOT|nr:tetratricopeptide repeat protein [Clostridium zeae]GFZ32440.1 hypothetical protein CSC2_29660 [Clostridium zeae]
MMKEDSHFKGQLNNFEELYKTLDGLNMLFGMVREYLKQNKYSECIPLLQLLCKKYDEVAGEEHIDTIFSKYVLGQVYAEIGELEKAIEVFESVAEKFQNQFGKKYELVVDVKLRLVRLYISEEIYIRAVDVLENLLIDICDESESYKTNEVLIYDTYYEIVGILGSLYSVLEQHEDAIKMQIVTLDHLLEEHTNIYEKIITVDNFNVDPSKRDAIISACLDLGASYSRINKYEEANSCFSKGYFIAFTAYGDNDERTLKQSYDIAVNYIKMGELEDGYRVLTYIHQDMVKYLDENNKYTIKAANLLNCFTQE